MADLKMLYELRYYYIAQNKMDEFLNIMESVIIPFQWSQGMMVVASFRDADDESCYIWLRRYKDEQDKQRLYDRVYGSAYWEQEIRPKIADMLIRERTQTHILIPTAVSLLQ